MLFAALATAGAFRLRRRPGWRRLPASSFAWPLLPAIFIAASMGMVFSTIRLRPHESLLGLFTVACGAVLYRWKFRKEVMRRASFAGGRLMATEIRDTKPGKNLCQ